MTRRSSSGAPRLSAGGLLAYVACVTARTLPIDLVQATVSFAIRQGWDVNAILESAGVSPMLLADSRSRVTDEQLVLVVQAMWRLTDDELFGLGSKPLPRGTLRLLLFGLLGAADLGEGLDRLQGFLRAVPAIAVAIDVGEDETRIRLPANVPNDPERIITITGLGAVHRLLAWGVGRDVPLLRVELPGEAPADLESLRYVFDGPLVFDAPSAGLAFHSSVLRLPLVRNEAEIEEFIARSPRDLLTRPSHGTTYAVQVRRILEPGLRSGTWLTAEEVAARLSVSGQTLRRRLGEEGTSVREILDEIRRDAAVAALVRGEAVADLAHRLGFSEPSAFTRAFKRWTGSTPGAYRGK